MNISYFLGTRDINAKSVLTIDDFISGIKIGRWRAETERIQQCETAELRKKMKKETASAVTVSGTFIQRAEANLIDHSGFICADFDAFDFEKYDKIKKDPYTYACFKSVSGLGVAVIVKCSKEKHKESFDFLQRHYFSNYGCAIDPAPRNVASLRFVSYDPDIYIADKSKVSGTYKETKRKASNTLPVIYGDSEVAQLVRSTVEQGINLAPDYQNYRDLGFALAAGFGESGRSWYHSLCQIDGKYNSVQCDKQFDRSLKGGKIGIGTFYWMLKSNGVQLPKQTDTTAQNVAMVAKKNNRTKDAVITQLVSINGYSQVNAERVVEEVYSRNDIDLNTMSKDPEKLVESLTYFMQTNWNIKRNAITKKYENNGIEINEEEFNTIFLKCRMAFGSNSVTWDLTSTIMRSTLTPSYNPIKEYIENNYYRNTSGNIDALCDSIITDTPNYRLFIRKWLLCIAAALDGKPVRSVLALVGGQNTGKTEWFRRILPKQLLKYYAESKMDAGKDDDLLMCQKLIVMDDEMSGKSKQDEKRFKELTSKQVFSLRAPYARANEDFKRLAVMCGTSNPKDILNDPTGNTRIFPIDVITLNHSKYNAIDKDELFIEIIKLYESGENYELTKEEMDMLNTLSENHQSETVEQGAIDKFFRTTKELDIMPCIMSATDIKCYIENHSTIKINNSKKFSQHLIKTFGEAKISKVQGKSIRGYEVVKIPLISNGVEMIPDNQEDMPF